MKITKDHEILRFFCSNFQGFKVSIFLKLFFHCIRNISESLYLKNYCVISFFTKIIQFFLGVDCRVHPPGYDNFLPCPQDRVNGCERRVKRLGMFWKKWGICLIRGRVKLEQRGAWDLKVNCIIICNYL